MPFAEGRAAVQNSEWQRRLRRADRLAERFDYAAEVLSFYREVLSFQGEVAGSFASLQPVGESFRQTLRAHSEDVLRLLSKLLTLVEEKGPKKLAAEAAAARSATSVKQSAAIGSFLASESPESFFPRALLQPLAEALAQTVAGSGAQPVSSHCPRCGSAPQAAVLRPEGDGGKRFLLCSLCLTEWEFRRIVCPFCGEEDHRKLPRYSAEQHEPVRVEACDTCHFYLKSIDLTIDGLAVPLVDEVASVTLDLWAAEHGYRKIVPNLMGF